MLIRQGRDMDGNAKTTKLVCNDQNLLYTALNRYIKLKTLFTKTFGEPSVEVADIAINGKSVVHVRKSNPLFNCGKQMKTLDNVIFRYENAPCIEEDDEYNLTGLYECTPDDQKKYVKGMIYDSADWFFYYQNHVTDAGTAERKAKLQRSFRKLFQSLNLLRVEYDLNQEEQTEDQNRETKRSCQKSQLHRRVQERITESLSAFFLETA
jgi:hypothetical protein